MLNNTPVVAGLIGLFVLSACSEEQLRNSNVSGSSGAAVGAVTGALIGGALSNGSRTRGTLAGAALGAGAGALIGQDLERQRNELNAELSNSAISVINTGEELIVRLPQDITFGVNEYTINSSLQADLKVLADNLNRYPDSLVIVVGHTDSTGPADFNQGLSERRANTVATSLRNGGVSPSRVRAIGVGENEPIATNQTEEGRAMNRRVDIKIRPTTAVASSG